MNERLFFRHGEADGFASAVVLNIFAVSFKAGKDFFRARIKAKRAGA